MKRIFLAIFDPPWWFLVFGWPIMIVAAIYFVVPATMQHYVDVAETPEMKLAIVREIKGAEQRVALEFAAATLRKVARFVPDTGSPDGLDDALEEVNKRIERGYVPPTIIDKPGVTEEKPKIGHRSRSRIKEKIRRETLGMEVEDSGDVHINFGLVDRDVAFSLEKKYGMIALPAVEAETRNQIRADVQRRVRHLVFGVFLIVILVFTFPLFVMSKIVMSIIRALSSRAEQSEKVAEQNSYARQLTEARLAAMQAQIEPHFLFNTMASVQQLIETDPAAAAKMQADLIKYLRAAIPQMRESKTTLSREVELSTAYLDILKIRMEDRLNYVIDLPPELAQTDFPPMILPTLVENAIKHGLEPRTEGGTIRITARAANGKLQVCVSDTGMGFSDLPGKGVGLTNVRERLVALYGRQAQLIIEPYQPHGAKVTLEIPYAIAKA